MDAFPHSSGSSGLERWYAEQLLWGDMLRGSEDRIVSVRWRVFTGSMEAGGGWFPPLPTLGFCTKRHQKKKKKEISLRQIKIKHLLDLHSSPHEKHVTLSSIKIILQTRKWFQHLQFKPKKQRGKLDDRREGARPPEWSIHANPQKQNLMYDKGFMRFGLNKKKKKEKGKKMICTETTVIICFRAGRIFSFFCKKIYIPQWWPFEDSYLQRFSPPSPFDPLHSVVSPRLVKAMKISTINSPNRLSTDQCPSAYKNMRVNINFSVRLSSRVFHVRGQLSLCLHVSYDSHIHSAWKCLQEGHCIPMIDIHKAVSIRLQEKTDIVINEKRPDKPRTDW